MNYILLFFKGILMGICDLIPGISGGTIAFITGIYSRLINAVKGFSFDLIRESFKSMGKLKVSSQLKKSVKKLDLIFLAVLFGGIGTALLVGSILIKYLLKEYFPQTISFFVGLIIASAWFIYKKIEDHSGVNLVTGLIGILIGVSLAFIVPTKIEPNFIYIFIGGFFAISAMFLPGISGAFILLVMGIYEFMLDVLHNLKDNMLYFISFALGAIVGAYSISRLVSYLFKKDKCKTLYFLLGLVIGALTIPITQVIETSKSISPILLITFVIVGAGLVFVINNLTK